MVLSPTEMPVGGKIAFTLHWRCQRRCFLGILNHLAPNHYLVGALPTPWQTYYAGEEEEYENKVYVMGVAAGQFIEMSATVGAMGQGLRFSIVGTDGTVVRAMGEAHVRTVVPSTLGYYVELASDMGASALRPAPLRPRSRAVRRRMACAITSSVPLRARG
jgi:hypothetical protein